MSAMIEYRTGNILTTKADVLVNTVNCVGVMGKGLAKAVAERYPEVLETYKWHCRQGWFKPGIVLWAATKNKNPEWVANFATKDHWRNPSRYEWIEWGLKDLCKELRAMYEDHGVVSVAIPQLGCSNGQLEWSRVKPMIERAIEQELDGILVEIWTP